MRPSELTQLMAKMFKAGHPLLITGAPGIGKTDLVHQAAELCGMDVILSHPSVSSPVDYKGLPMVLGDGEADFIPIGDLRKLVKAKKPTVFFMDDIGQAPAAVQAALMQLFRARRIGEHEVSKHIVFVGATNSLEHRSGVHPMLEAVKSRWVTIVELEIDVDEWVQWAISANVPPILIAFIMWKRNMLYDFQPRPGFENSPCPRTVEHVGKLLTMGVPRGLEFEVITGTIGEGFATEFCAFLEMSADLPPLEEALRNPDGITIPMDRPDIAFALVTSAADAVKVNQMENFVKLVSKFNKPIEVLGMLLLRQRDTKFQETGAFIQWAKDNQDYLF